MKFIFAAVCLVGALGLSKLHAGNAVQPSAPAPSEEAVAHVVEEPEEAAICPSRWTCDSTIFYARLADCQAACGVGACYTEPYCRPGCVCP